VWDAKVWIYEEDSFACLRLTHLDQQRNAKAQVLARRLHSPLFFLILFIMMALRDELLYGF
jgi:hypothetical protein